MIGLNIIPFWQVDHSKSKVLVQLKNSQAIIACYSVMNIIENHYTHWGLHEPNKIINGMVFEFSLLTKTVFFTTSIFRHEAHLPPKNYIGSSSLFSMPCNHIIFYV
jgi:hypothetical protein